MIHWKIGRDNLCFRNRRWLDCGFYKGLRGVLSGVCSGILVHTWKSRFFQVGVFKCNVIPRNGSYKSECPLVTNDDNGLKVVSEKIISNFDLLWFYETSFDNKPLGILYFYIILVTLRFLIIVILSSDLKFLTSSGKKVKKSLRGLKSQKSYTERFKFLKIKLVP